MKKIRCNYCDALFEQIELIKEITISTGTVADKCPRCGKIGHLGNFIDEKSVIVLFQERKNKWKN